MQWKEDEHGVEEGEKWEEEEEGKTVCWPPNKFLPMFRLPSPAAERKIVDRWLQPAVRSDPLSRLRGFPLAEADRLGHRYGAKP